jgi:GntR family transcriptional regulator
MREDKTGDELLKAHIDKNSSEPAYLQIAATLKELLRTGKISADTAMPAERVLAQQFGVSRMTMRQANNLMEREGLIERHRGRGTFATHNRIVKQEQEMRSFSEEIRRRGSVPSSRLISFKIIEADTSVAKYFDIKLGDPLYMIERVRLADNVPVAFESLQIPSCLCPKLERFNLVDYSLYQILEENYHIHMARSEEELSAMPPKKLHRKLLAIPRNTAVLLVKRKTYTTEGKPLELATTAYRGDLYTAVVYSLRSRKQQGAVQ